MNAASVNGVLDPRVEGRFVVRTDPHSHILPGLDDGSRDIGMSLKMARTMVAAGIENVVATPHGAHPAIQTNVHPDFLREQVHLLSAVLESEGIPLKIYPGTEVFLRGRILDMFDRGELITWADQGKFILVELGFQGRSRKLVNVIDELILRGVTPIIAHPERYLWLPDEVGTFVELRDRGCVFQFNMMSINGHFGPRTQAIVLNLLPYAGEYLLGSDSHSDAAKYFDFPAARQQLKKIGLLDENGRAIPGKITGVPTMDKLP